VSADALTGQFARTPYGVSFASEPGTITLVTLHVTYGSGPQDRVAELTEIAQWLARWARQGDPWGANLIAELTALAVPERQVMAWFQPLRPPLFRLHTFPVFNMAVDEGRYYGFPLYGIPGFKVGRYHHLAQHVDPDHMDREVHREDEEVLRSFTARYFPDAAGPTMSLKTCLFTNTPDEHFILDLHPHFPQVCLAAGFSGHGFKFCSVVGEIMAELAQRGERRQDLDLFRLQRFQNAAGATPS